MIALSCGQIEPLWYDCGLYRAFAGGDRANAPAGKDASSINVAQTRSARSGDNDPREQAVPGVRGANPARPLVSIERQRIRLELLAPEGVLELLAQPLGAGHPVAPDRHDRRASRRAPRRLSTRRRRNPALRTTRSAPRPATVRMKDRIVRILPALMDEAGAAGARIRGSRRRRDRRYVCIHSSAREDVRPDLIDEAQIARALGSTRAASMTKSGVASQLP